MIHNLSGVLRSKESNFIVIEVGGVGLKVSLSRGAYDNLPNIGERVNLNTYLHVKEDLLELYGFSSGKELNLFENLIGISGVGPKSALGILGVTTTDRLIAAIKGGKTDLITKVSGIGKKTAGRVVLELKDKLQTTGSSHLVSLMESDVELEETLVSLGYTKAQAREAISKIGPSVEGFKNRLKESLKSSKKN